MAVGPEATNAQPDESGDVHLRIEDIPPVETLLARRVVIGIVDVPEGEDVVTGRCYTGIVQFPDWDDIDRKEKPVATTCFITAAGGRLEVDERSPGSPVTGDFGPNVSRIRLSHTESPDHLRIYFRITPLDAGVTILFTSFEAERCVENPDEAGSPWRLVVVEFEATYIADYQI